MKQLRLSITVATFLLLAAGSGSANQISSGWEAQVRLTAGETFVTAFQSKADVPYTPPTPYGYVGFKLPSGVSFGLGLGFTYFKYNNTVPSLAVADNGWALMVAPTLQVPFIRGDQYEFYGTARFIFDAGTQNLQIPAAPVTTAIPFTVYGGNLGLGGTWYPIGCFGFGAEAGAAVNYQNANATTTTGITVGTANNINMLYVQTYFALTANYIF